MRLFKKQIKILIKEVEGQPSLKETTASELFRKGVAARNASLTYGGKSPAEIAFGRRN